MNPIFAATINKLYNQVWKTIAGFIVQKNIKIHAILVLSQVNERIA